MDSTIKRLAIILSGVGLTVFLLFVVVVLLNAVPLPNMDALTQAYWAENSQTSGVVLGYVGVLGLFLRHVWILWLIPVGGIALTVAVLNRTQNTAELELFLERLHAMEMALRDARERAEHATTRWDGIMHKLDELFANTADAWIVLDPAKGIRRWNKAALEIARLQKGSAESLEGRALDEVIPNALKTDLGPAMMACAEKQGVWSGEVAVPSLRLWLMAWVFPLGDDIALVLRDVSFKYQDDAMLRNAERLARSMVEDSPLPIAVLNAEWSYLYTTRNWRTVMGLAENVPIIGGNHKALVPSFPANLDAYMPTLDAGKPIGKDGELVTLHGQEYILQWRIAPWRDAVGQLGGYIFTLRDQTELSRLRQQVAQATERENALAYSDALTGLPNRQLFHDRLNMALAQAYRQLGKVALFFLDLDGFKAVNDQLGHDSGDLLLKQVANRLKSCVRNTDTVARLGGDEFTIILNIRDKADAELVAQKILVAVREPYNLNGKVADKVGTSIGIALYPQDGSQAVDLIRKADSAMYAAKQGGKNAYRFSTIELKVEG